MPCAECHPAEHDHDEDPGHCALTIMPPDRDGEGSEKRHCDQDENHGAEARGLRAKPLRITEHRQRRLVQAEGPAEHAMSGDVASIPSSAGELTLRSSLLNSSATARTPPRRP